MKNFTFYLLLFCVSITSNAQKLDLKFNTIEYDENFPQSTISDITQSKKGFIWVGTDNGLLRYDGYNFLRYYTRDKEYGTISDNNINSIYEDSSENLWVGTSHGVNLYNRNNNNFKIIDVLPTKGGRNYISSFVEDNQQNLWVGTFGGIRKIDKKAQVLQNVFKTTNPKISNTKIFSLFFDDRYGILVGTNNGLYSIDPNTGLDLKLPDAILNNNSFNKHKILKITKDDEGDLWFATESEGVFTYSEKSRKLINYRLEEKNKQSISSNNIKDILPVDKNTVWFSTDDGLNIFKKSTKTFSRYHHSPILTKSISGNNVTSLLKDREGSVWIGTKIGSLNFFNEFNSSFININESVNNSFGLNNSIINALASDTNNTFWAGTNGGGLNYLNYNTQTRTSYLIESSKGGNVIKALANKSQNLLLCGTLTGLYEFNKSKKTFRNIKISEKDVQVSTIAIDGETTWIGTDGDGLIKLSKNGSIKTYKKNDIENAISDNFILDIENSTDGLWISTQFGLNYFNKETKQFTKILKNNSENSLTNNTLTTLFTDSKDRLWIGLGYGGLQYYDKNNNKFYLINKEYGLTDGEIKSITEDSKGNLWLSANNSLFKIQVKDFTLPFKKSNFKITTYGSKNGISIKRYSINSAEKVTDKIVFGGTKGVVLFNPNKIIIPETKSKTVLTKLTINNKEVKYSENHTILKKDISEATEITLNHNQTFIDIQFSSLSFINAENNKYAYKLESTFNNGNWQYIGAQNNINLAALKAGNYLLKLVSLNEEDKPNVKIAKSLKINILPPWWQTNWAYFIYILILLSVFVLIINFIKSKIFIKQALLLEQTENERQKELYDMKLDFFTNISHEIRTPLTLIKGPIEDLLETANDDGKIHKKLLTVKKNSDRLLKLINELLDFRKVESKNAKLYCEELDLVLFCYDIFESFKGLAIKKNIDYKFVMNSKEIPVFFDKNQMEKVIYNLLSNAFKFTKKSGKIVISIEETGEDNNWVEIKIKDNGIGIPKQSKNNVFKSFFQLDERGHKNTGSGIGLALSKTIVELHSGKLEIEDEIETWTKTVFKISLLKGKKHLKTLPLVHKKITTDTPKSVSEDVIKPQIYAPEIIENSIQTINDDDENDDAIFDKKTVLIIDDKKDIREFISDILAEEYKTISFSNAQSALNFMENEIPDIIICDVMMPEINGFEFCEKIKTNEATNHIPIILLTAKTSTESRIDGLTIGADAYITKPFSTKVLKLNIINLLSAKEILRQKFSGSFIVDSNLDKLEVQDEVFIKKLMKIIEENIENPDFDVSRLVSEIGMSRTVLYKKVKALTDLSVASLIKQIRLKKASEILLKTNYNVSEIAYLVGFNDRKHFSKEFRKMFSLSPSEYRKEEVSH